MPDAASGALRVPNPFKPLANEFDAVARAGQWAANRHNWLRVGWVIIGGLLITIGAGMIVNRASGGAVTTAAGNAAKAAIKL